MKYSEFREWLDENNYSYREDKAKIIVDNNIAICKREKRCMQNFFLIDDNNLFIKSRQLATTPLEER